MPSAVGAVPQAEHAQIMHWHADLYDWTCIVALEDASGFRLTGVSALCRPRSWRWTISPFRLGHLLHINLSTFR